MNSPESERPVCQDGAPSLPAEGVVTDACIVGPGGADLNASAPTRTRADLVRRFHCDGYVLIPLRGMHEVYTKNGVQVQACGKEAFTDGWPETRETDLDVVMRCVSFGGNYGILPGASGKAVLDIEPAGLDMWPLGRFPADALIIRTPSLGLHVYLGLAAVEQVLGRELGKERLGNRAELFGRTGQVVGPGCRAYSNKAKREGEYTIVRDGKPVDNPKELARILEPFRKEPAPPQARALPCAPADHGDAWAWTALSEELELVATASEGTRHDAMMRSSFKLGQIVGAGFLDLDSVQEQLVEAAAKNGWVEHEARRCANDGIEAGCRDPRGPMTQPDHAAAMEVSPADDKWPVLANDALHGLAGDFVRMVLPHSESAPIALLGQFLVEFGNCIGRSAHFTAEADKHYTNIYLVLVGRTSKGRKGTSHGQVRRIFRLVDKDWSAACEKHGLSSGEGLIWSVRDAIEKEEPIKEKGRLVEYQTVVADQGISDKRLFVFESEFAQCLRVLDREGNTLSPVVRNAWDTGDLSTLTKNSPARATGAHISIIGHITQDEALRYLDRTEAANGFGNRFLWLCVQRSKVLPEGGRLSENELQAFALQVRLAVEFGRKVSEAKRDEGARELWIKVYAELSEGRPGLLGAITARAEAQVMRGALLYALLDLSSVIRREHLLAGLALWAYAEDSAAYVFGSSLGDPVADEILRALRASTGGLTRTQIRDLFGKNKSGEEIGRALGQLLSLGLARSERQKKEDRGRQAEVWFAGRDPGAASSGIRSYRSFLSYADRPIDEPLQSLVAAGSGTTETTEGQTAEAERTGKCTTQSEASPRPTTNTTETTEMDEEGCEPSSPTTETTITTELGEGDQPASVEVVLRSGRDEIAGPPIGPCSACGELSLWRLRVGGPWVCTRCHPPQADDMHIEFGVAG